MATVNQERLASWGIKIKINKLCLEVASHSTRHLAGAFRVPYIQSIQQHTHSTSAVKPVISSPSLSLLTIMNIGKESFYSDLTMGDRELILAQCSQFLIFLVGLSELCSLREENMRWLIWRGPSPRSSSLSAHLRFQKCTIHLSFPPSLSLCFS